MKYVQLIRLKHWVKNVLLFFPIIFSGKLLDKNTFEDVTAGFFAFSITASAVYVFNDLRDAEKDRENPRKKNRPVASGAVTERCAAIWMMALTAAVVGIFCFSHLDCLFWGYLICYVFINVCYSLGMKNVPIADVAILCGGYLLRIFGGGVSRHRGI